MKMSYPGSKIYTSLVSEPLFAELDRRECAFRLSSSDMGSLVAVYDSDRELAIAAMAMKTAFILDAHLRRRAGGPEWENISELSENRGVCDASDLAAEVVAASMFYLHAASESLWEQDSREEIHSRPWNYCLRTWRERTKSLHVRDFTSLILEDEEGEEKPVDDCIYAAVDTVSALDDRIDAMSDTLAKAKAIAKRLGSRSASRFIVPEGDAIEWRAVSVRVREVREKRAATVSARAAKALEDYIDAEKPTTTESAPRKRGRPKKAGRPAARRRKAS